MRRIRYFFVVAAALAAVSLGLVYPEKAPAQNMVQTVVVRNAVTGLPVPYAVVNVTDGRACYSPVATNAQGQATFRTAGVILTIQVRHPSYGPMVITPNYCATSYPVSIRPLPTTPQNSVLTRTNATQSHVLALAQAVV